MPRYETLVSSHGAARVLPRFLYVSRGARLVTPKAGLIIVLTTAASANLKTPCGRSKTVVPPANRFTSQAPHTASSVLPLAMASDVATLPSVVTFTRNAPTKIAGQAR